MAPKTPKGSDDRELACCACVGAESSEDEGTKIELTELRNEESGSSEEEHSHNEGEEMPPVRLMLLVMLCMFQGYASMVGPTQQKFKAALHVGQTGAYAHLFTQAANFVHWGKFAARLGHNIVFHCLSPTIRVYISMVFMLIGCAIPPIFVFGAGCTWVGLVFISYGLSGIGLGIFECTFLTVITPLGKLTKAWAIMGAPLGFGTVCVFGLICTSLGMPVLLLYWYIVACIPFGMLVFWYKSPSSSSQGAAHKQASMMASMQHFDLWLPQIIFHVLAKIVVNFVMENVTPVNFYTYNSKYVPLFSPSSTENLLNHDAFFALLYVVVILGDSVSRRVPYRLRLDTFNSNLLYLGAAVVCSITGFFCESFAVALVTLPAVFLAFWGNGLVYGVSAKYIDRAVPKEHHMAAYSFWCFAGDAGAIAGGALVDVVRDWVCGGHSYAYECVTHN